MKLKMALSSVISNHLMLRNMELYLRLYFVETFEMKYCKFCHIYFDSQFFIFILCKQQVSFLLYLWKIYSQWTAWCIRKKVCFKTVLQTSESETLPLETQLAVITVPLDHRSGVWYGNQSSLDCQLSLDHCHKVVYSMLTRVAPEKNTNKYSSNKRSQSKQTQNH